MREAHTYDEELVWWLTRQQIGLGLCKRYRVPKELPPELLALVKKLDTEEDNCSMRAGNPSQSDFLP
jgi:hypothetical protein